MLMLVGEDAGRGRYSGVPPVGRWPKLLYCTCRWSWSDAKLQPPVKHPDPLISIKPPPARPRSPNVGDTRSRSILHSTSPRGPYLIIVRLSARGRASSTTHSLSLSLTRRCYRSVELLLLPLPGRSSLVRPRIPWSRHYSSSCGLSLFAHSTFPTLHHGLLPRQSLRQSRPPSMDFSSLQRKDVDPTKLLLVPRLPEGASRSSQEERALPDQHRPSSHPAMRLLVSAQRRPDWNTDLPRTAHPQGTFL